MAAMADAFAGKPRASGLLVGRGAREIRAQWPRGRAWSRERAARCALLAKCVCVLPSTRCNAPAVQPETRRGGSERVSSEVCCGLQLPVGSGPDLYPKTRRVIRSTSRRACGRGLGPDAAESSPCIEGSSCVAGWLAQEAKRAADSRVGRASVTICNSEMTSKEIRTLEGSRQREPEKLEIAGPCTKGEPKGAGVDGERALAATLGPAQRSRVGEARRKTVTHSSVQVISEDADRSGPF